MESLFPEEPRTTAKKPRAAHRTARTEAPAALPEGWVLAHCDGGARGNPGPAGYGAVIVDAAGVPLAELSEFLGFRTNNFAEYSGLLAVLAWAAEQRQPRLRVISDSELMVNQIRGRFKVKSPDLLPLFEEARRRIARLECFEIHHALRSKNKVADRLANEAMDRGMGRTPAPAASIAQPVVAPSSSSASTPVAPSQEGAPAMLRGFVRDGVVHLLGGARLPDRTFVKILPE